jgi:polysaccharide biosynthesis/export protein
MLVMIVLALSGLPAGAQGLALSNGLAGAAERLALLGSTNFLSTLSAVNYVPDDKYLIRAGDKISLQILEEREPAKTLMVADSGELEIAPFGHVTATNKTCKQVMAEVTTLLTNTFFNRATVIMTLELAKEKLGRVYVVGQVRAVGALEMTLTENLTAGKAILRCGGFTDYAKTTQVKVFRPSKTPGGPAQVFLINMEDVFKKGKLEKDLPLEPDDWVFVDSKIFNL